MAFATTQSAAAAAGLAWMAVERVRHGKVTSLGLASGIVAGLVAITPAAGHVMPWAALLIGALASVVCFVAVQWQTRLGYDDSLDAFGVHGVGGVLGALLTGVFCFTPVQGLLYGACSQLAKQALGVAVALVYAGGVTWVLGKTLQWTMGLRAHPDVERDGLDLHVHGERGYHLDSV